MDIVNNVIRIEARKLQMFILTNTGELPTMAYCECEVRATLQHSN